jgi:hypothetical protein
VVQGFRSCRGAGVTGVAGVKELQEFRGYRSKGMLNGVFGVALNRFFTPILQYSIAPELLNS